MTNRTKFSTINKEVFIMDEIMPVSEVRSKLPSLIKKMASTHKHFVITRNGKPEAVLISPEEMETLEIKADPKLLRSILRAEEDILNGKLYTHKEAFKSV